MRICQKCNENNHVVICLYVDDMLVIGCNINIIITVTKKVLANKFEMKDLGVADVILCIKISRTLQGLVVSITLY